MNKREWDRNSLCAWSYQALLVLLFVPISQMLLLGCTTTYVVDKRDLGRVSQLASQAGMQPGTAQQGQAPGIALDDIALPVKRLDTGMTAYIKFDDMQVLGPSPNGGILVDVTSYSPVLYGIGGFYAFAGMLLISLQTAVEKQARNCDEECEGDISTGSLFMLAGGLSLGVGAGLILWGMAINPGVSAPHPIGGWKTPSQPSSNTIVPGISASTSF